MLIKMLQPRPGKAVDDALFKSGGSYFNIDQMMAGASIHCYLYSSVEPCLAISTSILTDKEAGLHKYCAAVQRKTMSPSASKPHKLPLAPCWFHVEIATKSQTPPVPSMNNRLVDAEADA